MKRSTAKTVLALILAVVLTLALGAPALAAKTMVSKQNLTVNGEAVTCQKYNIDGYNYFKLRDLAKLLDGTESQFNVDYDKAANSIVITTGSAYTTPDGTELKIGEDLSAKAKLSPQSLIIDGEVCADLTAYNIGGSNYFKLRELGKVLHFYVHYDEATNTALVDEQEEDEDWETGDASLDDPRNQDGMGSTEVLVVSFGTSFNDSRRLTIGAIEAAMEKAFPGYDVRRGFTADIIINHVYRRDDVKIDNITEAIQRAIDNGVQNLLVQPTHLMKGFEYDDVVEEMEQYKDKFKNLVIGEPILTDDEAFDIVIDTITTDTAQYLDGQTAICFMGHGTEHEFNKVYAEMQQKLTEKGYKDYFIGTVEAEPSLQDVVDTVKAAGYTKAILQPLMIVAGDHANNDMADPEDEESWVSLFAAAGIEATPILKGLGQYEAIQDLLVEHLKTVAAEALDEDYDTGDASLDNPRNQDGIGEKELLVVSFGTSFNDNRVETIGAIEAAMEKAFPEYSVRRGFTADIIINHVARRDGEVIDNIARALDRAVENGVKELYVQPTHLMAGYEYDDVVEAVMAYKDKFDKVVIGKQILDSDEDFQTVIKAITEATAEQAKEEGTAICFMGHGTEHKSNAVYAKIQKLLTEAGYENYFIGTVEAEPTLQDVVDAVKAAGYTKVYCQPLMIVAGDHANNDMADFDDPESWVSLFKAAGIEATPILKGLGSMESIQQLLVKHMQEAMEGGATLDLPTRDIADATDMTTVKDVEEEGMTPVTAVKDGVYENVKVKTSSSMFKIVDATLTVKDGKMTAVVTMSGKSYTWFFMGSTEELVKADDSAFIPYKENADGSYTFEIPVEALDQAIVCASYSKNKDQWYPRAILFRADSLPEGAIG